MIVITLDLEGVLIPEIWQAVAKKTAISELNRTTRDEPDYDKLMHYRLDILKTHNIKYSDIFKVIEEVNPLVGALEFLQKIRKNYQLIILSDTFWQFAQPLLPKLNYPTLFCHNLIIKNNIISGYQLRQSNQKAKAVSALRELNFKIIAAGDSYNDVEMIKNADYGFFIHSPESICKQFPQYPAFDDYDSLWENINQSAQKLNIR